MTTDYRKMAKAFFPDAAWIRGNGRYALVAFCRHATVSLHETEESAQEQKKIIDETGCGGFCVNAHKVIDFGKAYSHDYLQSQEE